MSFVAADSLAAHHVGGFFENFSTALRLHRFCNATKRAMHREFEERSFQLRTKAAYDAQIQLVLDEPTLASVDGVKQKSPLNDLNYFHVTDCFPADIAHDAFEGFVPVTGQYILKHNLL